VGSFDNIDKKALLAKLDTFPALRRTSKGWLEAGVVHEEVFSPTSSGVPQGGTITPPTIVQNAGLSSS
jgi:RNA-directed DNA polymerase